MTEDEADNLQPEQAMPVGVAIDKKHASLTVVVKSSQSKASPSKVIDKPSGVDVISEPSGSKVIGSVKNLDKINNLVQKEIALGRVGVTREKAYKVIASALDAKKWMDVVDKNGCVNKEYVDDIEKQRWGAEMAIKMFGDMIERKEIEMDVGDKTLDRLRSLSVAELKARAADLILGKKIQVVDAEVSRA